MFYIILNNCNNSICLHRKIEKNSTTPICELLRFGNEISHKKCTKNCNDFPIT